MSDPKSFSEFLENGQPGSKFVYHIGLLMQDRQELDPWSRKWGVNAKHFFAKAVYQAYEDGYIELIQEKLKDGGGHYIYYAVKRRYRRRPDRSDDIGRELFGSFSGPRSTRSSSYRRGPIRPNTDRTI